MSRSVKESVISQWAKEKSFRTAGPLFWAVIVQIVLLLVTVFIVVMVPSKKEEPEFIAHKTIYLPQKELDHRVAQSAFEQVASPPMVMERVQSKSMAEHALPDLPPMPESSFNPMMNPDMVMPVSGLFASGDLSSIAGDWGGGESSSFSFFGIKDSGRRIVIAFDVSKSVLNKAERSGVPVIKIKEETVKLIDNLNANTSFGVVQFVRRYEVFSNHLKVGTQMNKRRAVEWVEEEFHTSGYSPSSWQRIEGRDGPQMDGIQAVMTQIFEWEPDVVFLLSDGGFGRNYPTRMQRMDLDQLADDIDKLQDELPEKAKIHFIGFEMKEDRKSGILRIVRKSRGKFREF
ncbi:MAG: hypothetical protein MI748_15220 [Opitutales bacterium]|nr:hypothetical protein [Opitutales bacterium]